MKKILMTLAVAFVAVAANAQVYVGGSLGVASSEIQGGDDVTTYQVLPEIGYTSTTTGQLVLFSVGVRVSQFQ